ncbi:hypothetical protein RchiOBHm_Chr7g0234181 [Rosa chinensis]|uniref:Uncharacterized protein n=1 Tax=Rosa chinensis TaxID=74649 RepID=A0A2P6PGC7_ROSCH|nr:hypothetical protein RchiOBHm_Chr7g0234181 [Rosa chinensis]
MVAASSGLVVVDGDLVWSWSQDSEWSVKPSLKSLLGRRRRLLRVVTGSTMEWPHDGRVVALVRLPL